MKIKKKKFKTKDKEDIYKETLVDELFLSLNGLKIQMNNGEIKNISEHNYFYLLSNDIWQALNASEKLYAIKLFIKNKFNIENLLVLTLDNDYKITFQDQILMIDYDLLNNKNLRSFEILKNISLKIMKSLERFECNETILRCFLQNNFNKLITLKKRAIIDANFFKTLKSYNPNMIFENKKAFECLDNEFEKTWAFGENNSTYESYNEYKKQHLQKLSNLQSKIAHDLNLKGYNDLEKKYLYYFFKFYLIKEIEQQKKELNFNF